MLKINKKKLRNDVLSALREWETVGGDPNNLLEQLILVKIQRNGNDDISKAAKRLATNNILLAGMDELRIQDSQQADILKARFINGKTTKEIAFSKNETVDKINRLQAKAIDALTGILVEQEAECRLIEAERIESFLEPPQYTKLIGFDEAINQIMERVLEEDRSWVTAVVGMGGSGKTALADNVTRRLIRTFLFEDVIWIRIESLMINGRLQTPDLTYEDLISQITYRFWPDSANTLSNKEQLIQVRRRLRERPYLIIIDNLEAATDTAYLLDYLNDLANPSKFLLTTRIAPPRQANVYGYKLSYLTLDQAEALLRYHAEDLGLEMMKEATEKDINDIYSVAGGNPLALRLVVSLLDTYTLPIILDNLKTNTPGDIDEMYRRIFWQTWHVLSSAAKKLLKAMTLSAEVGATVSYLQTLTNFSENEIWPLIAELKNRSMLESRGSLTERRFGLHQLTITFLQTEIINWKDQTWQE